MLNNVFVLTLDDYIITVPPLYDQDLKVKMIVFTISLILLSAVLIYKTSSIQGSNQGNIQDNVTLSSLQDSVNPREAILTKNFNHLGFLQEQYEIVATTYFRSKTKHQYELNDFVRLKEEADRDLNNTELQSRCQQAYIDLSEGSNRVVELERHFTHISSQLDYYNRKYRNFAKGIIDTEDLPSSQDMSPVVATSSSIFDQTLEADQQQLISRSSTESSHSIEGRALYPITEEEALAFTESPNFTAQIVGGAFSPIEEEAFRSNIINENINITANFELFEKTFPNLNKEALQSLLIHENGWSRQKLLSLCNQMKHFRESGVDLSTLTNEKEKLKSIIEKDWLLEKDSIDYQVANFLVDCLGALQVYQNDVPALEVGSLNMKTIVRLDVSDKDKKGKWLDSVCVLVSSAFYL